MKAIPDNPPGLKDDRDFQVGYREGQYAYSAAMDIARRHYGADPPSGLRVAESLEIDVISHEDVDTLVMDDKKED